ncbi:MAG: cupin domain-containing protein [Myxococcota bacterium]
MMEKQIPEAVGRLVATAAARQALGAEQTDESWTRDALTQGDAMYANQNARLNIDFAVERLPFPDLQTMDPRIVRIAPGSNNERHKHAHESLFVILEGEGEVLIGKRWSPVRRGDVAFVPRWIMHQTRNTSDASPLVLLAITDFGFTSAVLGDYDRRTRLARSGEDAG